MPEEEEVKKKDLDEAASMAEALDIMFSGKKQMAVWIAMSMLLGHMCKSQEDLDVICKSIGSFAKEVNKF